MQAWKQLQVPRLKEVSSYNIHHKRKTWEYKKRLILLSMPRWWNWYTRRSQKPVPQGIGVRVPSWAPDLNTGTRIRSWKAIFFALKKGESFTTENEGVPSWAPENSVLNFLRSFFWDFFMEFYFDFSYLGLGHIQYMEFKYFLCRFTSSSNIKLNNFSYLWKTF